MRIKIISLQRHPQKEIEALEHEYLKRLSVMTKVEVVNIRPKADAADKDKTLREEEKLIQKTLDGDENLVVLNAAGKEMTTPDLSKFLDRHMKSGTKKLAFLIGGPQGISPVLLERAVDTDLHQLQERVDVMRGARGKFLEHGRRRFRPP